MAKYCPFCVARIDQGNSCTFCNNLYTYRAKPHHLAPGTLLNNKYLVGKVLGEGGFGITYVGRDLTLDMKVAIKEYFPSSMATRTTQQSTHVSLFNWSFEKHFKHGKSQFIQEAQTIAKMDKESAVVTVRDFFEQNNSAYIVMEFIEGVDLRRGIERRKRPLSPDELLPLLEPVFGALGELHKIGLIHRDISPDNIMVENGRARLIDFGCAREALDPKDSDAVLKHSFSPVEQYRNSGMGPWTDVYAMAATIYYSLTGKLPPRSPERMMKDSIVAPSALGVKLRPKQERALMKALAVNPQDRYQSMEDFGKDLFVHKNRYKFVAISACLVAVAAVAALLLFKPSTEVEVLKADNSVIPAYTLADDITSEDRETIKQLEAILDAAELSTDNFNDVLSVSNNSGRSFERVYFTVRCKSADGAIVANGGNSINDWADGESGKVELYLNTTSREGLSYYARAEALCGDRLLQTDFMPIESELRPAVSVELVNRLPETFESSNYSGYQKYEITACEFDIKGGSGTYYGDATLSGTVLRGNASSGYISYRITDAEGVVYDSGEVFISDLKEGDRFANLTVYITSLKEGEYFLELFEFEGW